MMPLPRVAVVIVGLWLLAALAGLVVHDAALRIHLDQILVPPLVTSSLGGDDLGRSIALRLIAGAGVSAVIAVLVVFCCAVIGVSFGIAAAWLGGWFERAFERCCDVFLAFPGLLLAIALAAVLGPGVDSVIIALSATGWVGFARLARTQTALIARSEHVQAARVLGVQNRAIVAHHVLPLLTGPLLVEASFAFAGAILAEAGLSFLGLGIQAPAPSWGGMIRDGVRFMLVAPHLVVAPALCLALVVLAMNTIADWLACRFDVRRRQRV